MRPEQTLSDQELMVLIVLSDGKGHGSLEIRKRVFNLLKGANRIRPYDKHRLSETRLSSILSNLRKNGWIESEKRLIKPIPKRGPHHEIANFIPFERYAQIDRILHAKSRINHQKQDVLRSQFDLRSPKKDDLSKKFAIQHQIQRQIHLAFAFTSRWHIGVRESGLFSYPPNARSICPWVAWEEYEKERTLEEFNRRREKELAVRQKRDKQYDDAFRRT